MKTNNKDNKLWHDSFSGRIIIGVIIGIILIFLGFLIKKYILTEPQQQQVPPQSPQLKLSDQNQTSQPLSSKDLQITADQIIKEIDAARPLQREDVAKTYLNIPVDWILFFSNGFPTKSNEYFLHFRSTPKRDIFSARVAFDVPQKNNDDLRLLQEGARLHVRGRIEKIIVDTIYLKDVQIIR